MGVTKLVVLLIYLAFLINVAQGQKRVREIPRKDKVEAAPKKETYYEKLDVSPSATTNEIKRAYRKMALVYHPDKRTEDSSVSKEDADAKFVELANAYEVLGDPVMRARYDYLVSVGEYEYDNNRNWEDIDHTLGLIVRVRRKPKARTGMDEKSARSAFDDAENEDWEGIALWVSLGGASLCAIVPSIFVWRQRELRRAERTKMNKDELKANQDALQEIQNERELERLRQKEEQAEEKRARDAAEREVGDGDTSAGGGGLGSGKAFKCDVCRKKFKSEQQLENHFNSNLHKRAVKAAGGETSNSADSNDDFGSDDMSVTSQSSTNSTNSKQSKGKAKSRRNKKYDDDDIDPADIQAPDDDDDNEPPQPHLQHSATPSTPSTSSTSSTVSTSGLTSRVARKVDKTAKKKKKLQQYLDGEDPDYDKDEPEDPPKD